MIEAKGETSDTGLDFRTGLGQLLSMRGREAAYALAVPDTARFERYRAEVAPWVRSALNLHWIIVSEDGAVRIEAPGD